MEINSKKIFICATEQSGDNIGCGIIKELLILNKNIQFDGVGGSKMSPLLRYQFFNLKDFNSMGIIEILFSLKKFFNMINFLVKKIINNKYDLIITIDSPDFNYPLAKKIKNLNKVKLIHIVAPSVWAWRAYRAKKFANIFNEIFVLFKFEAKYFVKYGLKTTFIGHPIYYIQSSYLSSNDINKYIAFLPGSRKSELDSLTPYFQLAYTYLLKYHNNYCIFIPTLPHLKKNVESLVSNWKLKVKVTSDDNEIENYFNKTSYALVCSGTASLEIAKRNIPQLVIYKLNIITEIIAKFFVNIKYGNILNIIENKMIITEITNSNLNKIVFIKQFKIFINSNDENIKKNLKIKKVLENMLHDKPPYMIASERVIKYLF